MINYVQLEQWGLTNETSGAILGSPMAKCEDKEDYLANGGEMKRRLDAGESLEQLLADPDDDEFSCDSCEDTRVAYWQDASGAMWKIACPGCVGYLDKSGNDLIIEGKIHYNAVEILLEMESMSEPDFTDAQAVQYVLDATKEQS